MSENQSAEKAPAGPETSALPGARAEAAALAPTLAQLDQLLSDPSVTRAAIATGVSQSTLSRAIARWESAVGLPLLIRSGRTITLTPQGKELALAARSSLELLSRTLESLHGGSPQQRLSVGFLRSLGPTLVGELVTSFHSRHPDVLLSHHEGSTGELLDLLTTGDVDVAVMAPRPSGSLHWLALGEQSLCLMVPANHPLADRDSVDLSEAREEAFLSLDERFQTRHQADEMCARAGFTPRVILEADDTWMVRSLVAVGLGVAILPVDANDDPRVRAVPIAGTGTFREVGLVWPAHAHQGPAAEAFTAHARWLNERYPEWADLLAT